MSEKNQNPSLEVFAQNLAAAPLVAILRGVSPETILPMCEAFVATQAGADFIKCFPVGSLGPGYIKNLRAVLATPILAVGGVSTDNIADYLKAGAAGVGVGSALFTAKATPESIRRNSAAFLAAVGR